MDKQRAISAGPCCCCSTLKDNMTPCDPLHPPPPRATCWLEHSEVFKVWEADHGTTMQRTKHRWVCARLEMLHLKTRLFSDSTREAVLRGAVSNAQGRGGILTFSMCTQVCIQMCPWLCVQTQISETDMETHTHSYTHRGGVAMRGSVNGF